MTSLPEKYRPNNIDEVVGHRDVRDAIITMLAKRTSQCFLLSGPPGTGKTTLLRIIAKMEKAQVIEVQGATHSGVDHMRDLVETSVYATANRPWAILIDECHRLSAQAWDAILKVTEEPKPGAYWLLSTTDLRKVPKAIQTRFAGFDLQPLTNTQLEYVVEDAAQSEGMDVLSDIIELCVDHAGGSARQALMNLAKVDGMDRKAAERVLIGADASPDVIDLIDVLRDTKSSFTTAAKIVQKLKDQSPEGIRIVVSNYMGKVVLNSPSHGEAAIGLMILKAFSKPYSTNEGWAPLLVSIGDVLFERDR